MMQLFTKLARRKKEEIKDEKIFLASQWQLMWWKFKRHKLAMVSMCILAFLYIIVLFCEFIAPYDPWERFEDYKNAPPQLVRFYSKEEGFRGPFVYGMKQEMDMETFRKVFVEDESKKYAVRLFVRGSKYKLWGLFESDLHLFGSKDGPVFLFGTDELGRDLFSRVIYGARISLTIGLVGVFLSFILGTLLGGISGYFGGTIDEVIQRTIDFLVSIPTIPLWMALSAAIPQDWSVIRTYFAITIILSLVGWGGLARVVRGRLLSLREEDFILAARLTGASEWRIITRHMLPSFASHLIASITLSIPGMILGETSLSFIGLGLRPPAISWGVLLQDAQQVIAVAHYPWRLIPAFFIIVTVLSFNFLGDGLRDAADPYSR
ncbi:peptide/nickel transport system permease protein [Caldicoprobacter faecalis]|uniref:Peptide/nickel transport system permease protein n=2 Tax=Caldicoprobacter faecalis TaxID=937334 RepID=A0A1I5YRI9_9FIRM|nr:ABC transporter permease [Caldicoprobacter faecalis]PZN02025.1 MAG: ABC transporter permease [Bacillota bacterium]SFQ46710.1 peptide/nickel transport system permease protein [Caldicoprobacter faecalis]